jgi:hypothetical protein
MEKSEIIKQVNEISVELLKAYDKLSKIIDSLPKSEKADELKLNCVGMQMKIYITQILSGEIIHQVKNM